MTSIYKQITKLDYLNEKTKVGHTFLVPFIIYLIVSKSMTTSVSLANLKMLDKEVLNAV